MKTILPPDDGDDNEGTEIRSWTTAPAFWIRELTVNDRWSELAWAELDRRGEAA